jgi:hypothetical protein
VALILPKPSGDFSNGLAILVGQMASEPFEVHGRCFRIDLIPEELDSWFPEDPSLVSHLTYSDFP